MFAFLCQAEHARHIDRSARTIQVHHFQELTGIISVKKKQLISLSGPSRLTAPDEEKAFSLVLNPGDFIE